jgi:hypothetical protein
MDCLRIAPLGIVLAAASLLAHAQTQSAQSQMKQPDAGQWRAVAAAPTVHAPFPLEGKLPFTVQIRPAGALTAQDQQLEANEESAIRDRAGVHLMDFGSEGWSYSQIDCPAFPGHLFLRFTRTGGKGDVSAFTASIPRFGQGKDRIIPIERHGYSLFSPAPINTMTIASFNHILSEERAAGELDWAAVAVCYAALAGTGGQGTLSLTPIGPPILQVQNDGGATIIFTTTDPRAKDWTMVFDRQGVLKKATHTGVSDYTFHPVPVDKRGQLPFSSPNAQSRVQAALPQQ